VFTMDLDAPELIQALDDFTKQILSPTDQLSIRLEEAIASSNPTDAAVDEICQIEGTRIKGRAEEEEEEAKKVAQLVATLQLQFPTSDTTFTANDTENSLPLQEPDFQILSEMFDEYNNNTDNKSHSPSPPESPVMAMSHIPIAHHWDSLISNNNNNNNKAKTELSCFLESYPYDSWDSPGSVESEIFPELSI